jgi:hypothetical protein
MAVDWSQFKPAQPPQQQPGVDWAQFKPVAAPEAAQPEIDQPAAEAETPLGEFVGGSALRFLQGAMQGTGGLGKAAEYARRLSPQGILEAGLASLFTGDETGAKSVLTRPTASGAFFDPGVEAADQLVQSEAPTFAANAKQGVAERDADGNLVGVQAPSAEWLVSGGAQTLPQLPAMLVGGGGLTSAFQRALMNSPRLAAALGYGTANASLTVPQQGEDAYELALQNGATEDEALVAGLKAAGISLPVNAALGGGSAVLSGLAGQGANSMTGAIVRGMAADVPLGAVEEGLQPAIVQASAGQDVNAADVLDAAALGGMFEAVVGAGPAAAEYRARQRAGTPPPIPAAETEAQNLVTMADPAADAARRVVDPENEASADDIVEVLRAFGIEPPPVPEQGGNPSPAAPAAGSQPGAVVSPINQPAPSSSVESGESPQQVQAVTGQAVPRDGVQAGAIIDRRIAELQAATQRGRVPNAPELQAELDELQAMLREQDAKLAQGINLAPADRLTPDERQTAEGRIVELRQQLEANRTATSAGYKLADLQRKLDRIDTDAGLIQLSQELSPLAPDAELARMFDLPPEAPAPAAQVQPQATTEAAPQAPARAAAPPAPPMSASPAAVTSWMKGALRRRGLPASTIDGMTAEQAMAEIAAPWPEGAPARPFEAAQADDAPLGAQFGEQAPAPARAPEAEQTFDVDVDYTKRKPRKKSASIKPIDGTGKPRSLLDWIAHGEGLDRDTFARELGIDPKELGRKAAGRPIFRKRVKGDAEVPVGMTPDEFREWLQTNDYVPRDQDDRPAEFGLDDALDMFDRAFRGGQDVFSYDQLPAVRTWQAARRGEVEQDSQGDDAPAEPIIERLPEAVDEAIAAGVPEDVALDAWNRATDINDFDARIRALIDEAGNDDFQGAEGGGREADSEGLRARGEDQGESRGDDGDELGDEFADSGRDEYGNLTWDGAADAIRSIPFAKLPFEDSGRVEATGYKLEWRLLTPEAPGQQPRLIALDPQQRNAHDFGTDPAKVVKFIEGDANAFAKKADPGFQLSMALRNVRRAYITAMRRRGVTIDESAPRDRRAPPAPPPPVTLDDDIPFQRREAARASGLPAGLPAETSTAAGLLARKLNADRARQGLSGKLRFAEVPASALPDDARRALSALGDATGTRVVVVRNLTPEVDAFNGVTFRDGVLYIDEKADRPIVLAAAHEWVHQLRRDDPAAYQRLEDEVRRQGNIPAWIARMADEGNRTDAAGAIEELTADAVADAMIDPDFLRRVAEEGGALRRAARSFLRFLDGMLARVRGRNTSAYMADVRAFRDQLAAVLRDFRPRFEAPTDADLGAAAQQLPSFQQRDDDGLDFDFGNLDDVPELDFDIAGELDDAEGGRTSTDTPAFRLWFRRSRVVDGNGDPLVVYHGTGEEFDAFDEGRLSRGTGHASSGLGFYFTPDRRSAKGYAEKASDGVPANENLLELYLSIQNPYRMTLREAQAFESAADSARRRRELQAQGYDGVHIPEQNAWVAFRAPQVKRTDNLGTWNPNDGRMRYQRRAAVDERLAEAFAEYEERFETPADLLETVEFIISDSEAVPQSVIDAARRFRQEQREDAEEWGGRGDSLAAGEAFVDAVQAAIGPAFQRRGAASGDLFARPTQAEEVRAEQERRDAQRNGRTGTGRTDMMAGPGDLFAGPRPEQADIEGEQRGMFQRRAADPARQRGVLPEAEWQENLRRWSGNAPMVTSAQAMTYDFRTGKPVVVEAMHGTKRPDRIGRGFSAKRATSGPMPYFTNSPQMASAYAENKQDTSLAYEDMDYGSWFKVKVPGSRNPVSIDRAWLSLSAEERQRISSLAGRVRMDDDGMEVVLGDEGDTNGIGSFDWELRQARGNPLKALVESWLTSGAIFNSEEQFNDVLRLAGFPMDRVTYDPPTAEYPAVMPVFIKMRSPLVTNDMPADVIDALQAAAKRDRFKTSPGADPWDKNTTTLRDWVRDLVGDRAEFVWTSIPDKVTDVFRRFGYDGIVDVGGKGGGTKHRVYIPFSEGQVKGRFNRGTFDEGQPRDILFQRRLTGDVFESALLKSVEEGKGAPKRGTAEQWKGWLDGAVRRGEFKQSERDWLDVDGWLQRQGGNVTRDALAEYVRSNQVELEETRLAGESDGLLDSERQRYEELRERALNNFPRDFTEAEQREYDALLSKRKVRPLAKFSQYQLPGGANYREVLLTLPAGEKTYKYEIFNPRTQQSKLFDTREDAEAMASYDASGETVVSRVEVGKAKYQSGHWDQPNVLAHVRMNERADAQGREVLFVEEIQSDWHQAGRKKGYSGDVEGAKWREASAREPALAAIRRNDLLGFDTAAQALNAIRVPDWRNRWEVESDEDAAAIDAWREANAVVGSAQNAVPDAPLKGTDEWAMLAFKRVVREAVERGKSVIAWTTGDQQAERYDLSKTISRVTYMERAERLTADDLSGEKVIDKSGVKPEELPDYIGKEAAEKLMAATPNNVGVRQLSGLELKVGGEGMRSFYDRILPAAVNKWAKKFGGRASSVDVQTPGKRYLFVDGVDGEYVVRDGITAEGIADAFDTRAEADAFAEQMQSIIPTRVHALEITPAMREAASGPMPLFQRRSVPQARAEAAAKRATADTALGNPMNGGALGWNPVKAKWVGSRAAMRKAREATQDKFISLRDLQQDIEAATGQPLDDLQNVYRLENLMHGRVQDGILDIERKLLEPLFDAMRKAGVEAAQLEEYLEARHAEERNKRIAAINPGMPDGGSGLTTAEARAILAGADRAKLEPLARRIDVITADTRRRLLASGVLTQEQFDAMEGAYNFYVPLRGIDDSEQMAEADRGGGIGRGIEQRGSGIKRAAGRGAGNRAVNILGEVIADAQRAVIAAEKARVGRGLARLVLANPNPNLWEIEAVRTERKFDAQGNVYQAVVNESAEPDVVHVLIKGKPYRVRIANPHVVQALKNLGANELHKLLRPLAALNRYVSATLTSYNPSFIAVNLARDATFGTVRVLAEDGPTAYASTVGGYGPAVKALAVHEAKGRGTGKMDQRLREFLGAGGKTGWVSMNAVEDLQRGVWIDTSGQLTARGLRGLRSLGRFVESANVVVENAMRLSYFNALRDKGLSVEQAAEKAKNLTVNFNRKGQWGNALSTAYLFFNPAIQGTHQVVKLAKNPKAMAAVATMTAVQVVLAMLAAGIEDEDGETLADKVPEYVKERNLWAVIPGERDPMGKLLPGEQDRIVTLPMPFGFNAVTYAGSVGVDVATRDMPEIASGARSPIGVAASVVGRLTNAFVGATSPVPLNDGMAAMIPTIPGQIVAGLVSNRDSLGRTIAQPQFDANNPEPLAYNARPETPAVFVEMAKGLNWLGGGDEVRRPLQPFDWAPEQLEYLWEWTVGGAGRFVGEIVSGSYNLLADPEALETKPAPIARAFTQPLNEGGATLGAYYDRVQAIEEQERRIRGIVKAQGIDAAIQYADSVPYMAGVVIKERSDGSVELRPGGSDLYDAYRKAQRQLKELRTEERAIYAEEGRAILNADRARRLREIRERRIEAVKDVNLFWNEAVKPLQD